MNSSIRCSASTLCVAAFAVYSPAPPVCAASKPAPRVAVFRQSNFPTFNVSPTTSPKAIAEDLTAAGVKADLLDVSALADPRKFNAGRYSALVLPYGNAFPQDAYANMKAFHQSSGIFVLSGVPFTHPVVGVKNSDGTVSWEDKGHSDDPGSFGPKGIGVGTFGADVRDPVVIAPGDPLRIASLGRVWTGDAQVIDTAKLPSEDVVTPILTQGGLPVAAIIEHNVPEYRGAIDVWTHHPASGDLDAYDNEQLMVRGTMAALAKKGLVTQDQIRLADSRLKAVALPKLYTDITLPDIPRAYETYQPTSPAIADRLYVADVRHATADERLMLNSLQGIVNRKQPRIYLIFRDNDLFWLDQLQKQGHTGEPIKVADPLSLVRTFRGEIEGAVVTDPKVYVSPHVAVAIAGLHDQVIASAKLAKKLRLPIKTDLRGKFKDDAGAYRYIRTELLPHLNPYIAISLDAPLDAGSLDQIIAARGMALWITGPKEQDQPGANEAAELEEVKAIFAKLPLNSVMRGFWYNRGDGYGIDEGPGVSLASRFGKVTVVSDYISNFSVHAGAKIPALKQKFAPAPEFDPTKIYVAFAVSDGDNLCTWQNNFYDYFTDPLHGTFPIAWGMGPTLLDVAPDMAKWFYDNATPNDEFICDVSGVGYISPPDWAKALKDREGAFASFYDWTQQYMTKLDMKTLRLMYVNEDDIARVGKLMPGVKFLFPDYGYTSPRMTYDLPTGQAVFRTATGGPATSLTEEIRAHVGKARPAFVNAFVINWGMHLSDIKKTIDDLGPEYVPVTPSQLYSLYRQANMRDTN